MATTSRIRMPLLSAGQAQKEISHNEALLLLDALVHGTCAGQPTNAPPSEPEVGLAYLCGEAPSGEWAGHAGEVACWTIAGWRFAPSIEGFRLMDRSDGCAWEYHNDQWSAGVVRAREVRVGGSKVLGNQRPAIAGATGGATVDAEARATLSEVLRTLRAHGLIAS